MSGTPVLSALTEGLARAVPLGLRGVLNATANVILSQMAKGLSTFHHVSDSFHDRVSNASSSCLSVQTQSVH